MTDPLSGGVGKFGARRLDLLIRDAACAASARALNAFNNAGSCPGSAEADIRQIRNLINQSRRSSVKAIADGNLTPSDWTTLDGCLVQAEGNLSPALLNAAAAGIFYPFFGILLSPILAAAATSLSSVSVVSNALRLRSVTL